MIRKLTIILAVGCLLTSMAMGDVWQDLAKFKYGDSNNAADEALTLLQNTPVARHAAIETKLIALISSKDATQAGKSFACRMLQQIGTEKCVPAVSGLLNHETLSHYARLSLEMIDSPKASAALLAAMPKTTEKIKCGIIMSLGNRRESKAVKAIAASLGGKETAAAAMRSLAMIGGKAASACLAGAKAPAGLDAVLKESQIVCAESLEKSDAAKVCGTIFADKKNSPPIRVAALRGLMKANGKTAAPIIVKLIKGKNGYMKQGAMRIVASDRCKCLTGAVASALGSMPEACQLKVLDVLAQRGDITALKGVAALYSSSSTDVKLAAYKTAGQIGDTGCIMPLLALANDKDHAIARKAVSILGLIDNKTVDPTLASMISDPELGPGAIAALTRRGCTSATDQIIKLVESGNVETKIAGWKAMSNLASDKYLDSLMKQIVRIRDSKVRVTATNAIKNICTNSGDRRKCFDSIEPYYAKANTNLKTLILNIGATTGGVKAIATAKTALASSDAEIRIAALRALMEWQDSGAADTLLDIAKNAKTNKDKILAIRGYIQVTGKENPRTRVGMYMKIAKLAESTDAKNQIISGLRILRQLDSLQALTTWFDDKSVKATAEQAALDIVNALNRNRRLRRVIAQNKKEILAIIKSIKDTSKNKRNADQATKLYKELGGK
jgi:HEAT repeat protein